MKNTHKRQLIKPLHTETFTVLRAIQFPLAVIWIFVFMFSTSKSFGQSSDATFKLNMILPTQFKSVLVVLDRDYINYIQVANRDTVDIPKTVQEIRILAEGYNDQILTPNKMVVVNNLYQIRFLNFTKAKGGPPNSTYSLTRTTNRSILSVENGFSVLFQDSLYYSGKHVLPFVEEGHYTFISIKNNAKTPFVSQKRYITTLNENKFSSAPQSTFFVKDVLATSSLFVPGLTPILAGKYTRGIINFSLVASGFALANKFNKEYQTQSSEFDVLYRNYQQASFPSIANELGDRLDKKAKEVTSSDNRRRLVFIGLGGIVVYNIWDSQRNLKYLKNAQVRFDAELNGAKLIMEF